MFPKPHNVEHLARLAVGENALGQPVTETAASRTRSVIGWSYRRTSDGGDAVMDDRIITEVALLTDEPDWYDGDTVILPGQGEFVVHGQAHDCNNGPFGFTPGYRVILRRVHVGPS